MFDTLVFIGRFQPFHNGHKAVIDAALENAKQVIVIIGSSNQARSIKNPFTYSERVQMIQSVYPANPKLQFAGVMDYPYDDNAWVSAVQDAVHQIKQREGNFGENVGLIGHSKDHSSYYLKIFPDWRKHVEVPNVDGIDATTIRDHVLNGKWELRNVLGPMMPEKCIYKMDDILYRENYGEDDAGLLTDVGDTLFDEYKEVQRYKEMWEAAPYPPTFVTTDAVLHQSGYILLVKRGGFPFKDYWALPGGYLAKGQYIADNMIKELREETCVKVPEKVLKGSIKDIEVFDKPDRDPRGRTITHAFFVDLGYPDEKLPKVKGADDAKQAEWFKISDIKSDMMAFDHYHIIKHFIPTY